ncbi:MAG: hypothetical protein AVDCRST_MAG51-2211, partial [uncultured Ramlibacter sp.]
CTTSACRSWPSADTGRRTRLARSASASTFTSPNLIWPTCST